MNGAQSLVQTLVNCGVEICFANPGTWKCIWSQASTP